jgi:N-sulfoglucosamine sulfohydrolase
VQRRKDVFHETIFVSAGLSVDVASAQLVAVLPSARNSGLMIESRRRNAKGSPPTKPQAVQMKPRIDAEAQFQRKVEFSMPAGLLHGLVTPWAGIPIPRGSSFPPSKVGQACKAVGFVLIGLLCTGVIVADDPPNILVVISDDQTWLHTSIDGDPVVRTPHFDRVAAEGVRFTRAFCGASSCSPSRAALLTGQHIWRLGPAAWIFGPLHPSIPTYVDLLEGAGYVVGATGKGWGAGPLQAWRHRNPAGPAYQKHGRESPENFTDFLEAVPADKPFCFWFGSSSPHRPFAKGSGINAGLDPTRVRLPPHFPDTQEIRAEVADYLFEIEEFDRQLGAVLATLEQRGRHLNTIVVVTSDNGMDFPRAKATLYDLGTHVPLAIRWPRQVPRGRTVNDLVNFVDLAPTFLEAARMAVPVEMSGQSLLNILRSDQSGRVDPSREMVCYGLERHSPYRQGGVGYPCRALRTEQHLYIRNYFPDRWPAGDPPHFADPSSDSAPKQWILANRDKPDGRRLFELCYSKRPPEELYDLQSDPAQMTNVAHRVEYQATLRRLREALEELQTRTGDPRARTGPTEWDNAPAPHSPFLFPEFRPADNDRRMDRLKEQFSSRGGTSGQEFGPPPGRPLPKSR